MREREKLIEDLHLSVICIGANYEEVIGKVADFILADRKRIVSPLISDVYKDDRFSHEYLGSICLLARIETLKLAGVTNTDGE